jgi:ubiquinol-cytochrome c reductase cytochrome c1 subunit
MFRKLAISAVTAAAVALPSGAALAAGAEGHVEDYSFPFEGPFGRFDQNQLQRGLQVYTEVCSACHGLRYVPLRTLSDEGGPGLTEEEVRAYIEMNFIEVYDESIQDWRSATPNDNFPTSSLENAPDLSLMTKARAGFHGPYGLGLNQLFRGIGGPEYVASILTHYTGSEREEFGAVLYGNETFPGGYIAMAPPLWEDAVEYNDGTPATVEQMAQDVAAFLTWTAEPKLMARKQMGFTAIIMLSILSVLLYLTNKRSGPRSRRARKARRPRNNGARRRNSETRSGVRGAFFFVGAVGRIAHHPSEPVPQHLRRILPQPRDRPVQHHAPLLQQPHPIAQPLGIPEVVRRNDVGQPARLPQRPQKAQHLGPESRIERGKRLIQQCDGPVLQQQPRQGRAPLLPARQAGGSPAAHAHEPHLLQRVVDLRALRSAQAEVPPQGKAHILRDRQMRKKVPVLEQDRHRPFGGRERGQVPPLPRDAPCHRQDEPRQERQERALAAARGAQHRHAFPPSDRRIDGQAEVPEPQIHPFKPQHPHAIRPPRSNSQNSPSARSIRRTAAPSASSVR